MEKEKKKERKQVIHQGRSYPWP